MRRVFVSAFVLILSAGISCPSMSQTRNDRHATVSTRDLDLNSRDGATVFLHRLDSAAAKVCGPAPDIRDLERREVFTSCVVRSKGDAIAHLNNAKVTAVAAGASQKAVAAAKPKIYSDGACGHPN